MSVVSLITSASQAGVGVKSDGAVRGPWPQVQWLEAGLSFHESPFGAGECTGGARVTVFHTVRPSGQLWYCILWSPGEQPQGCVVPVPGVWARGSQPALAHAFGVGRL